MIKTYGYKTYLYYVQQTYWKVLEKETIFLALFYVVLCCFVL